MSGGHKSVINNASALFVMQMANYVLPFVLIPYLTQTLGTHNYGVVAFGLAIVQMACIITDYGFNISATYQISTHRHDKLFIEKLIGAIYICKILLFFAVCVFIFLYVTLQKKYIGYELFLLLMPLAIIGQTIQPLWFFQGVEKMMYITVYTVIARILYICLVLMFVKQQQDFVFLALANGFSLIVAGLLGVIMMLRMGYRPKMPNFAFVKETLAYSTEFFWSRAAVATYTSGGTFFLGLFSTPQQTAFYSAAEQLYKGAQAMYAPVSQALYPYMAHKKDFSFFFKVFKCLSLLAISGIFFGYILGEFFIDLLFGKAFYGAYSILLVFLLVFAITTPSVLLGYPFLGALGHMNAVNKSVVFAGIVQIGLLVILTYTASISAIYVVFSVLIVELTVLIFRAVYARKIYINKDYSVHTNSSKSA